MKQGEKMKSLPIVLILFIVLLEVHRKVTYAAPPEKSCQSVLQDMTKTQLTLLGQCGKQLKFKNGKEKSKKQNCILRCAMIKAELLTSEGQVSMESIDGLMDKYMPPSLQEKANTTFWPCMEMGMKEPFPPVADDQFCMAYDPFVKCFMQKVGSFCS